MGKNKDKQKEAPKTEEQIVLEENIEGKKVTQIAFFMAFTILIGAVAFLKPSETVKTYAGYYFTMAAAGFGLMGFFLVKNTIGWKLAINLMKVKKLRRKGYGILKIMNLAGSPEYKIVKYSPLIPYTYVEAGINKNKLVAFDKFAITEEWGVPIITCNPNDILPINIYNGSRITVSPELMEKNIVDNSKSAETIAQYRKYIIYGLIGIGILAGLTILGFDLYSQRLAESNQLLAACYREVPRSATILAQNLTG